METNMRKGILFVLLLGILVAVMPIAAQDEIVSCSEEELTLTAEAISQLSDGYQALAEEMGDGSDPNALMIALVGIDSLSTGFQTNVVPELPACAESIALSDAFGLALDESVINIGLARLSIYEAEYGDADLAQSYADYAAARAEWYAAVVEASFGVVAETGELPEASTDSELPACTDEFAEDEAVLATGETIAAYQQLAADSADPDAEKLTELVAGYAALSGAFRVGIYPALPCAEAFAMGKNLSLLLDRTLITMLLARLGAYEAEYGEVEVAAILSDAATVRHELVTEFGLAVFPQQQ
jgi:hypothetical protein